MTDFLQQAWFPVTAILAMLAVLIFALNQRSRQRRRAEMNSRPIIVMPAEAHRDDGRLS